MSKAIYLSPTSSGTSTVIFIQINKHNPRGWIEKPNGQAIKLQKPQGDNL